MSEINHCKKIWEKKIAPIRIERLGEYVVTEHYKFGNGDRVARRLDRSPSRPEPRGLEVKETFFLEQSEE